MAKQHSTGDLYQKTTDRIIEALEAGTVPWIKPWTGSTRSGIPMNLSTGKEYRGINIMTLWCASVRRGFDHDLWITYNQAQDRGWQVRKGAKAEQIIKVGQVVSEDADAGDENVYSYLRAFSVFNIAEVEGAPLPVVPELADHERIEHAETLIGATGARIVEGGDRAFYSRAVDSIHLPVLGKFVDTGSYYSTKLHELTHWSGNENRLNRQFGKRFGDDAYAAEELVAEIGSAFLSGVLGIEGHLQHPEYIASWLTVLKGDKRAIFTAASKATQAADYLRGIPNGN